MAHVWAKVVHAHTHHPSQGLRSGLSMLNMSPVTPDKKSHSTSTLDGFPRDIKSVIAVHLGIGHAAPLSQVNHDWQDVAEEVIWARIERHFESRFKRVTGEDIHVVQQDWDFLVSALERRPARQLLLRHLGSAGAKSAIEDIIEVLALCPKLEEVRQ